MYTKLKNNFFSISKNDINFAHTLTCGQIFSYKITENGFDVFSGQQYAKIFEQEDKYIVETDDIEYFKNFFDLHTDYDEIKKQLSKFDVMKKSIEFGSGIRILKQDLLETIISFVISANNRIPRIQKSVFYIREHYGSNKGEYFAFPTLEQLSKLSEEDLRKSGVGFRAKHIVKLVKELQEENFVEWKKLPTSIIRNKLIALSGIGPKVADCVLLFGYGKSDVFPVDTWIAQMFNEYFHQSNDKNKMRQELVEIFGKLSGYAQQYLFFYQREN